MYSSIAMAETSRSARASRRPRCQRCPRCPEPLRLQFQAEPSSRILRRHPRRRKRCTRLLHSKDIAELRRIRPPTKAAFQLQTSANAGSAHLRIEFEFRSCDQGLGYVRFSPATKAEIASQKTENTEAVPRESIRF